MGEAEGSTGTTNAIVADTQVSRGCILDLSPVAAPEERKKDVHICPMAACLPILRSHDVVGRQQTLSSVIG